MSDKTLEQLKAEYEAAKVNPYAYPPVTLVRADALIAAQQARIDELETKANALSGAAKDAMGHFTFLVGREPNILVSGDRGVIGLVGETAKDIGALQMLLNDIAIDEMYKPSPGDAATPATGETVATIRPKGE